MSSVVQNIIAYVMNIIMHSVIRFEFSNQRVTLLHTTTYVGENFRCSFPVRGRIWAGRKHFTVKLRLTNGLSAFIFHQPKWQKHSH